MGHDVISDIKQDDTLPVYVGAYALLDCLQFAAFYEIYFYLRVFLDLIVML